MDQDNEVEYAQYLFTKGYIPVPGIYVCQNNAFILFNTMLNIKLPEFAFFDQ